MDERVETTTGPAAPLTTSSALVTFNVASGYGGDGECSGGGLVDPIGLAVGHSGNVSLGNWNSALADAGAVEQVLERRSLTRRARPASPGGGLNGCAGVAIDASGNAWVQETLLPTPSRDSSPRRAHCGSAALRAVVSTIPVTSPSTATGIFWI